MARVDGKRRGWLLTESDYSEADFTGADLSAANLSESNFRKAKFVGARLGQAQLVVRLLKEDEKDKAVVTPPRGELEKLVRIVPREADRALTDE